MTRKEKIQQYLRYWQILLNLQSWKLNVELVKFNRPDWPQSGDIKVDLQNKKATILLLEKETGKDSAIILHELMHLIFWEFDHFCEKNIPETKKKEYFNHLERFVADLTNIFLHKDK